MSAPAVETTQLARSFGEIRAVDGVDLRIERGEIYGFLGPNGAGKSTLVRMLVTLLAPSGGRGRVAGFDIADQPDEVRLRIGAALQDAALDARQTGRELLRVQGRLYGLRGAQIERRLAEVLDFIDIGEAIDRRIGGYSGGMRRRLDLAAALVHDPEVLFLDEPTTGLDPVSRGRVWDEVRRLNAEHGVTIFLTTQYLEEADALAGRVGIIDRGRIVAEGAPEELKRAIGSDLIVVRVASDSAAAARAVEGVPGVESASGHDGEVTIASRDGAATIGPVAVALADAGVEVVNLTLRTPTLDDVFLEMTGERIRADEGAAGEGA